MLSFLSPLFLVGAIAAAIPIVLHLLKREPEPRVKFSAVKLLKHAPVEYAEQRHLRELLLLALRIATLVLLALAFARPFLASGAAIGSTGVTMIALDTSFSMSAPGMFERARQLAKAAVDRAAPADLVGVVTFSDVPNLVAKPSADRAFARSAIDAATAGFGATRYRGTLSAAVQALGGRRGTIVVVTDLQESGWEVGGRTSVPESARIEIADVGPSPGNLAVTAIHAEGDRIVATVGNSGVRSTETRARLTLDARLAGETTITVGPKASADAVFAGVPKLSTAKTAAVTIDDREGMQADNVRYALIENRNRPAVLIVTSTGDLGREAFYVQQALAAGAVDDKAYQLTGASPAQLSTWDEGRLSAHAVIVLLSTRGLERRAREALAAYARNGGGVLIAVGPEIDGDIVGDVLGGEAPLVVVTSAGAKAEERALAPADVRHPIFQSFGAHLATLGLVKFQKVARIGGSGCQTVARFTTGEPALLECSTGDGHALVLASDLDNRWNDFPLHATFVPFLHEAVRYVASARPLAGDYLVGDVPAGVAATPGIVALPDGPANRVGDSVQTVPRRSRQIAVNVDPRESDPARISAEEFQAAVTRLKDLGASNARVEAGQQEDRQHLWQYALLLTIVTLVAEGFVASRTA